MLLFLTIVFPSRTFYIVNMLVVCSALHFNNVLITNVFHEYCGLTRPLCDRDECNTIDTAHHSPTRNDSAFLTVIQITLTGRLADPSHQTTSVRPATNLFCKSLFYAENKASLNRLPRTIFLSFLVWQWQIVTLRLMSLGARFTTGRVSWTSDLVSCNQEGGMKGLARDLVAPVGTSIIFSSWLPSSGPNKREGQVI